MRCSPWNSQQRLDVSRECERGAARRRTVPLWGTAVRLVATAFVRRPRAALRGCDPAVRLGCHRWPILAVGGLLALVHRGRLPARAAAGRARPTPCPAAPPRPVRPAQSRAAEVAPTSETHGRRLGAGERGHGRAAAAVAAAVARRVAAAGRRLAPIGLEDLVARTGGAVVMIEAGNSRGTGFFVRPDLIVTNDHVVDGATAVTVRLNDGSVRSARVERTVPDVDLALLRTSGPTRAGGPAARPDRPPSAPARK